jgi:hypothetical protein
MSRALDSWYVRFPDGRVMRASSTAALRHHLETGLIPSDSRVRRSPDDEWLALDWMTEFSDLAPQRPVRGSRAALPRAPTTSSGDTGLRANHMQLQAVGVRGLVEELLAALDSSLVRSKLVIAALTALGCGVVLVIATIVQHQVPWPWLPWLVAGLLCLGIVSWCAAFLTQMTFIEVSQLRPALWREATVGLGHPFYRLLSLVLLTGGVIIAALVFLRMAPIWVVELNERGAWEEWLGGVVTALALLGQVVLWPFLGFLLLLPPVVLIEEHSLIRSVGTWCSLVWRHLSRVILYEALAIALACVLALPFVLPVVLTLATAPRAGLIGDIADDLLMVLGCTALTPLLAYLLVANVFIFLNLRYEHTPLVKR